MMDRLAGPLEFLLYWGLVSLLGAGVMAVVLFGVHRYVARRRRRHAAQPMPLWRLVGGNAVVLCAAYLPVTLYVGWVTPYFVRGLGLRLSYALLELSPLGSTATACAAASGAVFLTALTWELGTLGLLRGTIRGFLASLGDGLAGLRRRFTPRLAAGPAEVRRVALARAFLCWLPLAGYLGWLTAVGLEDDSALLRAWAWAPGEPRVVAYVVTALAALIAVVWLEHRKATHVLLTRRQPAHQPKAA